MSWGSANSPASTSIPTTGTTGTNTFSTSPGVGDLVVAAVAINGNGWTFPTAPTLASATWANSGSPIFTDNSTASQSVAFWVGRYAGSGTTLTAAWNTAATGGGSLSIASFSGLLSGPTVDGSVQSIRAASGTSLHYTPTVSGDLCFYYISTAGAISSIASPWTAIEVNMAGTSNGWAYQIDATTAQVSGTADEGSNDLGVIFGVEIGGGVVIVRKPLIVPQGVNRAASF